MKSEMKFELNELLAIIFIWQVRVGSGEIERWHGLLLKGASTELAARC